MPVEWGPIGTPNLDVEQSIDLIKTVLQQLKDDGGQVLLYPGKNRTLVVYSKNNRVHLITEAVDG